MGVSIEAWAKRHGIPIADAMRIQRLMKARHSAGEHECNGDTHPGVADEKDKNANTLEWRKDRDNLGKYLDGIAARNGLTMDFGTGLWGSVMKDGCYIDDVPSED